MNKIGVNSRIVKQPATGISNYIINLYGSVLKEDKNNSYIFFQLNNKTRIGKTSITKLPSTKLTPIIYDMLYSLVLIKRYKLDIYHGPAHILPIFKLKNTKYIVTIHDLAYEIFPEHYPKFFLLYYRWAVRRSSNIADVIIAVSENTKKDLIRLYDVPRSRITVIPLGIDTSLKHKGSSASGKYLSKEKYFFSISTHPKRKNIYNVIIALSKAKKLKQYKYKIAGLVSEEQKIKINQLSVEHDVAERVEILGYVSDEELCKLYENASFFIYPSYYEGFGIPVIESMALMCPVIAGNNSSMIENMPDPYWLVDPNNVDEISGKMSELAFMTSRRRNQLLHKNSAFAAKFTWQKSSVKTIEIFNKLGKFK